MNRLIHPFLRQSGGCFKRLDPPYSGAINHKWQRVVLPVGKERKSGYSSRSRGTLSEKVYRRRKNAVFQERKTHILPTPFLPFLILRRSTKPILSSRTHIFLAGLRSNGLQNTPCLRHAVGLFRFFSLFLREKGERRITLSPIYSNEKNCEKKLISNVSSIVSAGLEETFSSFFLFFNFFSVD